MNGANLHLVLNHIPVLGMPFGLVLLAAGALRKSKELTQAGLAAMVLAALFTAPVFLSGEPAEDVVRSLPGIERTQIHEHEESAEAANIAVGVVGVGALIAFVLLWKTGSAPAWLTVAVLAGGLVSSAILARTAHLGGLVRHPEIASPAPPEHRADNQ